MSDMRKPYENKAAEPEMEIVRFSRKNALWLFLIAAAGLIFTGFLGDTIAAWLPKQPQLRVVTNRRPVAKTNPLPKVGVVLLLVVIVVSGLSELVAKKLTR